MMTSKQLTILLTAPQQLRVFHWQTSSYAEHVAYGVAYEALNGLTDTLLETLMGMERQRLASTPVTLTLGSYNGSDKCIAGLQAFKAFLSGDLPTAWAGGAAASHLDNIRDEMLAAVDKCIYLLSLQ